jgi:hypothetical protein
MVYEFRGRRLKATGRDKLGGHPDGHYAVDQASGPRVQGEPKSSGTVKPQIGQRRQNSTSGEDGFVVLVHGP